MRLHGIKLAIVDDIDNYAKKALAIRKELQDFENSIDGVIKLIDNAKSKVGEGVKMYDGGLALANKFGSELENLGIQPRSNPKYTSFFDTLNGVQEKVSRIQTKIKQIK
jgi:hypothetical protein